MRVTKTQGAFAPTSCIAWYALLAAAQHHDLSGAFSTHVSVLLPGGAASQGWACLVTASSDQLPSAGSVALEGMQVRHSTTLYTSVVIPTYVKTKNNI